MLKGEYNRMDVTLDSVQRDVIRRVCLARIEIECEGWIGRKRDA